MISEAPRTVNVETGVGIPKPLEAMDGRNRAYRDVLVARFGISSADSTFTEIPLV
ncbi:MAG: hypothetical protein ACR2QW_07550 [bacterium]